MTESEEGPFENVVEGQMTEEIRALEEMKYDELKLSKTIDYFVGMKKCDGHSDHIDFKQSLKQLNLISHDQLRNFNAYISYSKKVKYLNIICIK